MMLTAIPSLHALTDLITETNGWERETDRINRLISVYLADPRLKPSEKDPHSAGYRDFALWV